MENPRDYVYRAVRVTRDLFARAAGFQGLGVLLEDLVERIRCCAVIERFWFGEAQEDAPEGRNADVEIFHSRADLLADA